MLFEEQKDPYADQKNIRKTKGDQTVCHNLLKTNCSTQKSESNSKPQCV